MNLIFSGFLRIYTPHPHSLPPISQLSLRTRKEKVSIHDFHQWTWRSFMPIAITNSKCFESVKLIDKEKRSNAFLGSVTLASIAHFICQVSATHLAFFDIYFFVLLCPLIIINRWRCAHSVQRWMWSVPKASQFNGMKSAQASYGNIVGHLSIFR